MKKAINIRSIILVGYMALFLGIYIWILHPIIFKPTGLSPTQVPSLSITGLKEASSLSSTYGKRWLEFPVKPDINNYNFGQTDPI